MCYRNKNCVTLNYGLALFCLEEWREVNLVMDTVLQYFILIYRYATVEYMIISVSPNF